MERYERPRLAEPLLQGIDMLSNMHANSTIPEIQGYARAYEVTGKEYYRRVVEAYWEQAVEKRGMYATGSQTSGEVWSPMGQLKARLGDKNQEHCVVYNMMRLSEYLLRWTGDAKYADYWEKNLYNGIYAQGFWQDERSQMICGRSHHKPTTVTYYMPLMQGSQKYWGSETDDFWCCHCTLVQANAIHHEHIFYTNSSGIAVAQYIPAHVTITFNDITISLEQTEVQQTGGEMMRDHQVNRTILSRPHDLITQLRLNTSEPVAFDLSVRVPGWIVENVEICVNGTPVAYTVDEHGFAHVERTWDQDTITVRMGKKLSCFALPDDPDMVAFMDGPICLAGLVVRNICCTVTRIIRRIHS